MTEPITDFTTVVPFWKPRVTPVELDKASEEQLEAMKVTPSDTGVGAYVLVLAHDPQTLKERTPLFNGIMYSHGGLSRTETELGAVAASLVCSVLSTRCPVSEAWMAISAVSRSRISPTRMTSGSWRRYARRPDANVRLIFGFTAI